MSIFVSFSSAAAVAAVCFLFITNFVLLVCEIRCEAMRSRETHVERERVRLLCAFFFYPHLFYVCGGGTEGKGTEHRPVQLYFNNLVLLFAYAGDITCAKIMNGRERIKKTVANKSCWSLQRCENTFQDKIIYLIHCEFRIYCEAFQKLLFSFTRQELRSDAIFFKQLNYSKII